MSSSMCAGTNQTTKHISGRARRSPIAVCRWNNRYITPTMGSLLDQEMQIPGVLALQLCKSSDPSPDACIDKKRKTGHLLWNNDWLKVLPDIELSWWAPFHWFLYLPSHYVSEKKKPLRWQTKREWDWKRSGLNYCKLVLVCCTRRNSIIVDQWLGTMDHSGPCRLSSKALQSGRENICCHILLYPPIGRLLMQQW